MRTPSSQHGRKGSLQGTMKVIGQRPNNPSPPQQIFDQNHNFSHILRNKVNSTHINSTPWIQSKEKAEEKTKKLVPLFSKDNQIRFMQNEEKPKRKPRITEPGDIVMRLNQIAQLKVDEALFLVTTLIDGFSELLTETGRVSINLSACGVSHEGKIKVRTHSRFSVASSKNPMVGNQVQCVLEIIQAVKEISESKFNDFYSYYLMSARRNKCGFKYTKNLIKSYISCMKQKLPTSLNIQKLLKYPFSLSKSPIKMDLQEQDKKKQNPLAEKLGSEKKCGFYPKSTSRKNPSIEKILTRNKLAINEEISDVHKSGSVDSKNSPPKLRAFLSNEKQRKQSKFIPRQNALNITPKSSNNIINQFSFVFNPRQTIGECLGKIKQSEISTTQKTYSNKQSIKLKDSTDHGDWIFGGSHVTYKDTNKFSTHLSHNELGSEIGKATEKDSMKIFHGLSLLPQKLEEVESFGESSSEKEGSENTKKEYSEKSSEREKKQKRNEIILKNCWTNKIEGLFSSATPALNSSRVEGTEPEPVFQTSITQKLDKWARVISNSIIPEH